MLTDKMKKDLAYQPELVELRGYVLNKAIATEKLLDIIIVNYYIQNKELANHFHSNVNSELSFTQKRKAVRGIIENFGFEKKDEYVKSFKYLENIGTFRNKIAHWPWQMISDESEIILAKNEMKKMKISSRDVEEYVSKCTYVNRILSPFYFKYILQITE